MNTLPIMTRKDVRWTGALLLVLVAWFLVAAAYHGALNPESGVRGGDFKFFYYAAVRLNHNEPLYEQVEKLNDRFFTPVNASGQTARKFPYEVPVPTQVQRIQEKNAEIETGATYVYPPLLAILLRPVAAVTHNHDTDVPELALKIWFCASATCLLLAVAIFALAARWTLADSALIAIALIVGFHFWPSVMTFGLGQTNMITVLALAGIFYGDSKDKPLVTAASIAFGALFKTWFIAWLLVLLLRRAWGAAAACCAIAAIGLAFLFTIVGWHELPIFVQMTVGYAAQSMGNQILSQSIAGFAQLHFMENAHIKPLINAPWLGVLFRGIADLAMLSGLLVVFLRQPKSLVEKHVQLALVTLSLLLLLPYCQTEYLVLTIPVFWVFLARPSLGVLPFGAACVAYVALTRGGPYYPVNARAYQTGLRSLMVSVPFFMASLLWLAALLTTIKLGRSARQSVEETPAPMPSKIPAPIAASSNPRAGALHA